jgi:excisionase family DNA binding protein
MHRSTVNDDVMSTREAAQVLGVALRTVQLWVESGVLPAWKTAGGHRRIAREAVERLALERRGAVDARTRTHLRMLVVEDEPDLLRLYALMIEGWDLPIQLDLARNGFEGLVRLGERRHDVLITDLMMPGMDGFRMLAALQDMQPALSGTDIVVVSALSPSDVAERGGLPDGVHLFTKPVPFDVLEQLVRARMIDLDIPVDLNDADGAVSAAPSR